MLSIEDGSIRDEWHIGDNFDAMRRFEVRDNESAVSGNDNYGVTIKVNGKELQMIFAAMKLATRVNAAPRTWLADAERVTGISDHSMLRAAVARSIADEVQRAKDLYKQETEAFNSRIELDAVARKLWPWLNDLDADIVEKGI